MCASMGRGRYISRCKTDHENACAADRPLMAEQILREASDRNYSMDSAMQQQIEQAASQFRATLA